MIWFTYYSNSGCTARFIHEYVFGVPEIRLGAKARRVFASSPHGKPTGVAVTSSAQRKAPKVPTNPAPAGPRSGDTVILCVPTYGRFDHNQGKTVDYVPKCLRIDGGHEPVHADGAVVLGNMNFGREYCAAARDLTAAGIPILARVEMSGSPDLARTVVRKAMILDGLDPLDPRLPRG